MDKNKEVNDLGNIAVTNKEIPQKVHYKYDKLGNYVPMTEEELQTQPPPVDFSPVDAARSTAKFVWYAVATVFGMMLLIRMFSSCG